MLMSELTWIELNCASSCSSVSCHECPGGCREVEWCRSGETCSPNSTTALFQNVYKYIFILFSSTKVFPIPRLILFDTRCHCFSNFDNNSIQSDFNLNWRYYYFEKTVFLCVRFFLVIGRFHRKSCIEGRRTEKRGHSTERWTSLDTGIPKRKETRTCQTPWLDRLVVFWRSS